MRASCSTQLIEFNSVTLSKCHHYHAGESSRSIRSSSESQQSRLKSDRAIMIDDSIVRRMTGDSVTASGSPNEVDGS